MPDLQVLYGPQNYIFKGNLLKITNSPSQKNLNNFLVFDLVTFSMTLNSQPVYLQKTFYPLFFKCLYCFVQHSAKSQRSFFLFSYNINFSNLYQGRVYTNKE